MEELSRCSAFAEIAKPLASSVRLMLFDVETEPSIPEEFLQDHTGRKDKDWIRTQEMGLYDCLAFPLRHSFYHSENTK